jgi:hypothetical protein
LTNSFCVVGTKEAEVAQELRAEGTAHVEWGLWELSDLSLLELEPQKTGVTHVFTRL